MLCRWCRRHLWRNGAKCSFSLWTTRTHHHWMVRNFALSKHPTCSGPTSNTIQVMCLCCRATNRANALGRRGEISGVAWLSFKHQTPRSLPREKLGHLAVLAGSFGCCFHLVFVWEDCKKHTLYTQLHLRSCNTPGTTGVFRLERPKFSTIQDAKPSIFRELPRTKVASSYETKSQYNTGLNVT